MGKPKNQKKKKKQKQANQTPRILSRKEKRKEKRKTDKQLKQNHYLAKFGKAAPELVKPNPDVVKKSVKFHVEDKQREIEEKKKKKETKFKKAQQKQRKLQLKQANLEDERTIKKLEKQLKLNKRKTKALPASFKDDGLDYLLDVLDPENLQNLDSDDDDLELGKALKADDVEMEDQPSSDEDDLDEEEGSDDEGDDESNPGDVDDGDQQLGEDMEEHFGDENDSEEECVPEDDHEEDDNDDEHDSEEDKSDAEAAPEEAEKSGFWEDIYGRTRDADGNVVKSTTTLTLGASSLTSKYVPPALRAQAAGAGGKTAADAVILAKLTKQVKGALNRLAESNLHVIARQIEDLFMSNSRNLMNECLCQILTSSLISPVLTPERLVMEHALLISILHANVGTEVGANILQTIVTKYVDAYKASGDLDEIDCKTLDNYLQLIAQMYAFQIVGHELIFDILDGLSNSFRAKDIELIVLTLRTVGFLLRKDSPMRLKTFILQVQKKSSETDKTNEKSTSLSRVQFMLEIVMAIRNNNVKKIPNYDPTHQAHLQKISKTFHRPGCSVTPLNVRMDDLTSVNSRGRWWIVGSAWAGKNLQPDSKADTSSDSNKTEQKVSAKLLEMARKLRMNTEARKNLFCALMSADDYLDAFERLVKVDKAAAGAATRERDTAFVVLACCLRESTFNPFYSTLAVKLGTFDRKYRMAIQCCIWDRIRDISNMKKNEQLNLARFTSHLIKDKLLSLTCLKVIEFSELNKHLVKFIKQIIVDLLNEPDPKLMVEPFLVVAGVSKLSVFRDGLRLFLRHFMLRKGEGTEEFKAKIEAADSALIAGDKRIVF